MLPLAVLGRNTRTTQRAWKSLAIQHEGNYGMYRTLAMVDVREEGQRLALENRRQGEAGVCQDSTAGVGASTKIGNPGRIR